MVGIVLVSHSRPLAEAVRTFVRSMTGPGLPIAVAAGAGPDRADLGTDATAIVDAIQSVMSDDGVLVLTDIGSAVLSAETAIELLDESVRAKVRSCAAPFVEGAVAAGVTANLGAPIGRVANEAERALHQKQEHIGPAVGPVASTAAAASTASTESASVTVVNDHGLHARPAARLVQECARFDADVTIENTTAGTGPAPARSLSALASLEVTKGDQIRICATGPQAPEAVASLRALVGKGLGDSVTPADRPAAPAPADRALPVSPGIAIGPAIVLQDEPLTVPQHRTNDPAAERTKLLAAVAAAREGLLRERERAARSAGAETADIFAAQASLLDDPVLAERAEGLIAGERANAAAAWHTSILELVARYRAIPDEYLRQRAADVVDLGRRVMAELGVRAKDAAALPLDHDGILIADDLTPTQASHLAGGRVSGVICLDGGATSHSSILLRALDIPAVAQARTLLTDLPRSAPPGRLAMDGSTGEVWVDPDDRQLADVAARRNSWEQDRVRQDTAAHEPAVTTDGRRIELFANVGHRGDAEAAVRAGAEGVGLLRTEFLFLDRASPPAEAEQVAALRPIVEAMGGQPVVVRTLDAGGDKRVPYLGLAREANPFLGVRAVRVSLRHPDVFRTQLRALLRAGTGHDLRVMFPMVSDPAEFDAAVRHLESAHTSLAAEGVPHAWPIRVGTMVEVPSAAMLADELAARCDFLSIGTNDLTQYVLAADRGHPGLREYHDALHPAVLRLIRRVARAARRRNKVAAVCGEAAGDVTAALLFVGLGVDELSVVPTAVARVKDAIRRTALADLRAVAHQALDDPTARAVRDRAARAFPDLAR